MRRTSHWFLAMNTGAAPGTEPTAPNPDIVDAPPGYEQGFERIPFENVLWIKYECNKEEPIFYVPLAHPRVFIPQDKMLELAKYLFVTPEEVEFPIEDIQGVNDFKVSASSQTAIYIQDIKVDVLDTTGDMTHPTQFLPFPDVSDLDKSMALVNSTENREYGELPICELVQNSYVQKIGTSWEELEIGVSRRDVRWKTINIRPEGPNFLQTWKIK